MSKVIFIVVTVMLFLNPAVAQEWEQLGPGFLPNVAGGAKCFVTSEDNELIIGFAFVKDNNGQKLARIAKWDGTSLQPMGCGFTPVCDEVSNPNANLGPQDFMYFQDTLYACGRFTHSGDTELNNIAKWDGESWLPMGLGVDGRVEDIMVHEETIYICGSFTFSGGTSLNGLAQWNGEEWLPVFAFPQFSGSINFVNAMQFFQGELFVGGNFNGESISDLVVFRDGIWQSPNGWFCGPMSDVTSLAIFQNELIVAGSFNEGNCINAFGNSIVSFNGDTWDNLNGGLINESLPSLNNQIRQLHVTDEYLYCAGVVQYVSNQPTARVARWDGNEWCSYQPANFPNEIVSPVFAVTLYNNKLVLGGGHDIFIEQDYINALATFEDIPFNCYATSVDNTFENDNKFSFYPNPASDSFSVRWDTRIAQQAELYLRTLDGRTVLYEAMHTSDQITIDTSTLAEGFYVLTIQLKDSFFSEKIIVSR